MTTTDTFVQVAPDSTGKKIRNLATDSQPDVDDSGNVQDPDTTYMQMTVTADADGRTIADTAPILREIKALLIKQNELLELILDQF